MHGFFLPTATLSYVSWDTALLQLLDQKPCLSAPGLAAADLLLPLHLAPPPHQRHEGKGEGEAERGAGQHVRGVVLVVGHAGQGAVPAVARQDHLTSTLS